MKYEGEDPGNKLSHQRAAEQARQNATAVNHTGFGSSGSRSFGGGVWMEAVTAEAAMVVQPWWCSHDGGKW